jgi:tRNA G18 (ribose-2'-O)-methylase SpoU
MAKLKLEELNRVSVEAFKTQEKLPIVLVLDEVRSLHNVGSIFRTADGFAVEAIVLCGITAQPPHREIEKTALGATQSIDWSYFPSTVAAVLELKVKGYTVLALEQASESIMLTDFTPTAVTKYAIILGNEVNGVNEEVIKLVDGCLEIPQFGTKHSFNVVVSAGIVLWDFFAKWHKK